MEIDAFPIVIYYRTTSGHPTRAGGNTLYLIGRGYTLKNKKEDITHYIPSWVINCIDYGPLDKKDRFYFANGDLVLVKQ